MRRPSFIIMIILAGCLAITSCKKKEEVRANSNSGNGGMRIEALVCTYTIKASESVVDGSKLNLPPGSVVCFEAGQRGPLYIKNFNGAEGKPITFINSGGKTVIKGSGSWALKVGYCKNIRFTGSGSSDQYGILIDGGHNGFVLPELCTDYEIDRVEVKNTGFAGIMAKTDPNCDSKTWRNNYIMKNVSFHDNYIHDVGGEGFYIGNSFYNGKSESCGTVYPHEIHGLKVFNNITKNTGCEGIQVGCAIIDTEIHDNYIENPGNDPFAAYQNNGLQVGAGTGGNCYNNVIKNAPGNGLMVNGVGGNKFYNNLILNSGALGIFCDERTEIKEGYSFINNTIVNTGSDGIKLYSEKVPYNHVINNIIINPGSGKYINTSSGVRLTDQNNYFHKDIATVKFANPGAGNYTLVSGSPAVNAGADVSIYGITKDLIGGVRPFDKVYDIGAYEFAGVNVPDPTNPTPNPTPDPTPDPTVHKVVSLTLINADTDKDIAVLTDGYVIDFAKIGTKNLNIRANTNPTTVGSVVFGYDATAEYRVESWAPYPIGGDEGEGKYNAWTPSVGSHTVTATAYSASAGGGTKGTAVSVKVVVQEGTVTTPPVPVGQTVTSLTLINADTDQDIAVLTNGYVIDYAKIGTKNINIRANTNPVQVGSVVFGLDANSSYRVESWAPYPIGGDEGEGKYNAWTLPTGSHSISATPYSSGSGAGTKGNALAINVTVQNGTTTTPDPDPEPAPNPNPGSALKMYPVEDAYLDGTKRYNNNILRMEGTRRVAYLKYNVSGLGANKASNAKIRLKVDADAGFGNVRIGRGSHDLWTSNTITLNNKPAIVTPITSLNAKFDIGKIYEFDVSSAISGDGTYTFIITLDEGGNDFAFSSGEGVFKPELLINQ